MTSNDVQTLLEQILDELGNRAAPDDELDDAEAWKDDVDGDGALANCAVTTFADGGYLTRDAGLVVRLADGSEFQITIVQSQYAATDGD